MADRPSFAQDLAWRLEAFALDAIVGALRLAPVDAVSDVFAWLAGKIGPLTSTHRVAERNIRIAFPDMPDAEVDDLLAAQWASAGRWAGEFFVLDRIMADPDRIEVVNGERLAQIARDHEPVVFITGHFSSFEIMPAVILRAGVPLQVTYRAANNPHVEARFRKARWRYGVRDFAPKGMDGGRAQLEALSKGGSVAQMIDQKYNGGVAVPFFGQVAHSNPGAFRMALKFGAALQPLSLERKDKARFRVVVHDPIVLAKTGDRAADVETGVLRVNQWLEERIVARPEEWFWVHKRWPNELYR